MFRIRWHWNTFRHWAGLTPFSPMMHEVRRIMIKTRFKEVK